MLNLKEDLGVKSEKWVKFPLIGCVIAIKYNWNQFENLQIVY